MKLMKRFVSYDDANSLRYGMRAKRAERLLSIIEAVVRESERDVEILDVGGTKRYWNCVDIGRVPGRLKIILASPSLPPDAQDDDVFTHVEADGRSLTDFEDGRFDLVHSNSVIEHVGRWDDMRRFASEIKRLAGYHYVQTPNYWFPVEPHFLTPFFQFLPVPMQLRLVRSFSLGHMKKTKDVDQAMRIVQSSMLLTRGMLSALFPDSKISAEKFMFMTKSFMVSNHPAF